MTRALEMRSKLDVADAHLAENKRCFNQAADNPCMQSPFYDLLGPIGITEANDRILDGTFEIPRKLINILWGLSDV